MRPGYPALRKTAIGYRNAFAADEVLIEEAGPVVQVYRAIQWNTERRLQCWLRRRAGQPGTG